jgi:2-amino-4-hydroxy-6-hydroxymethyldihydropteridine diphosphokinase
MPRILVALGSNLADPAGAVALGWHAVCTQLGLIDTLCSDMFVTQPAEGATGASFVNAVGRGECTHSPMEVLVILQSIEAAFGRDRAREGFHGARPLDLDLLDHGGVVLDTPALQLPHPRLHQRAFVLRPLAQVTRDFVDARTGRTLAQLLASLS